MRSIGGTLAWRHLILPAGLIALAFSAPHIGAAGRSSARPSGLILANVDRAVSPRQDLFDHANGTWLRTVPIPAERAAYGVQQMMVEGALVRQRSIAEAARSATDPDARKVGALYASFMDEPRVEAAGLAPLSAELARIDAIGDRRALASAMGRLDRLGMTMPISTYVAPDAVQSGRYALWLSQNDLGMPGRDYFLSDDPKYADMRARYRAHVAKMLALAGDADADRNAAAIVGLEIAIARLQWAPADRRDPQKTYNPSTQAELEKMAPGFDWPGYFAATGLAEPPAIAIARQPDYLAGVAGLMNTMPLGTWKAYLRYLLVGGMAPYLPRDLAAEEFAFSQGVVRGTKTQPERWKRACDLVDRLLGEQAGKLYAALYFPPAAKARIDRLAANLLAAYRERINTLDWMAPETRAQALAKLAAMTVKVGYPRVWRDYAALDIRADDLAGNVLRAQQFDYDRQHRRISRPVDRDEWQMTVATPDAYYAAQANEVAFPAGILQPPLFDPAADDAFNYGSTGATIGHEMSHAFDNRGSHYDAKGVLRDWWTPANHAEYDRRTAVLVRQFDGFEALPGEHVNGRLVLSETIADLAGLSIAWHAYLRSLDGRPPPVIAGLTGAQRFFIGYAQSYLGKRRDDALLALIKSNPHPPERYRVNGIVVHLPQFHAAFGVKPGDGMYLAPDRRAVIW